MMLRPGIFFQCIIVSNDLHTALSSFIPYYLFPLARLRETTMRAASMTSSGAVPMSRA